MPTPSSPYTHLAHNVCRSKEEWIYRLGQPLAEELSAIGALEEVDLANLVGFTALFDFHAGVQEYEIYNMDGTFKAYPINGGASAQIYFGGIVLRANPIALIKKITEVNKFELTTAIAGQSPMVGVAERIVEGKKFILLIIFDDQWIKGFGAEAFIKNLTKNSAAVLMLSDCALPTFSLTYSEIGILANKPLLSPSTKWQIDREWYCNPRFGLSTAAIVKEYPDKKIFFDGLQKKIYLFGEEIKVEADSRPFNYLKGICFLGSQSASSMALEIFANQYLNYSVHDAADVARKARTQAKKALEATFTDKNVLENAVNLCMPDTPRKTVKSGFQPEDIHFIGS